MANFYFGEDKHWETAKSLNISFPKEVKSYWDRKFIEPLLIIETRINEDLSAAMELDQTAQIVIKILAITQFIHSIKKGDQVKIENNILYVPWEIRELIRHHLANDIQKVFFILSDSFQDGAKVLTSERRTRVKPVIDDIKGFNEKLFGVIRV